MKILYILIVVLVIYLLCSKSKNEGFVSDLYGDEIDTCKEDCTAMHPEAARMDLDADNSIADFTMSQCIKECRAASGKKSRGCSSCG